MQLPSGMWTPAPSCQAHPPFGLRTLKALRTPGFALCTYSFKCMYHMIIVQPAAKTHETLSVHAGVLGALRHARAKGMECRSVPLSPATVLQPGCAASAAASRAGSLPDRSLLRETGEFGSTTLVLQPSTSGRGETWRSNLGRGARCTNDRDARSAPYNMPCVPLFLAYFCGVAPP